MKKLFSLVAAAVLCAANVMADEVVYDCPATNGSNSSYDGSCEVTVGDYTWVIEGNCTMEGSYAIGGWGIGGGKKNGLENQDRAIYTKSALKFETTKIEVSHAKVFDGLTINSLNLVVSDASNAAGDTIAADATAVVTDAVITFECPEGKDWTNKNYKFVYNLSCASGKNLRLEVTDIKFYGLLTAIDNIEVSAKAVKQYDAELGQVVIIRNGVKYNALGVEVGKLAE